MEEWQKRTALLLGDEALPRLAAAKVLVAGAGGVGGYAVEMLVRAGVGHIVVVDSDDVSESNLNRQILALHSTIGRLKCDVVRDRMLDINPALEIKTVPEYLTEENIPSLVGTEKPDFVIDAIDTLSPKVALIQWCLSAGVPLVSSMGAGAKTDCTAVRIDDISRTKECPLAKMIRKKLHKAGIRSGFEAVYSLERPDDNAMVREESRNKRSQVGSISYIPAVFGCACAQAALRRLLNP